MVSDSAGRILQQCLSHLKDSDQQTNFNISQRQGRSHHFRSEGDRNVIYIYITLQYNISVIYFIYRSKVNSKIFKFFFF